MKQFVPNIRWRDLRRASLQSLSKSPEHCTFSIDCSIAYLLFTFYLPCLCSFDCVFSLFVYFCLSIIICFLCFTMTVCQQTLALDSAWEDLLVLHLEYLFCLCLVASWFPLCFTCLSTISPLTHCRLLMFRIHMLVHCIFREINRCLNFSINECYELNKDYQNKTFEWFVSALQMAL